jgi:hypothetical protein
VKRDLLKYKKAGSIFIIILPIYIVKSAEPEELLCTTEFLDYFHNPRRFV